jgi:hypothetical protein
MSPLLTDWRQDLNARKLFDSSKSAFQCPNPSGARFSAALTPALLAQAAKWVEQGPGPIINGQDVGLTNPTNPVSGAINAIATVPGDPNTLYVAAVNGGIWKTTNATAATPTWTPLTDTALPALSMRSLAIKANPGRGWILPLRPFFRAIKPAIREQLWPIRLSPGLCSLAATTIPSPMAARISAVT